MKSRENFNSSLMVMSIRKAVLGFCLPQRAKNLLVMESFTYLKMKIKLSFSMEIIILVAWGIWISRNNKNFNNQALSFQSWKAMYLQELTMMAHRMKKKHAETFTEWLQTPV
jgi:hypothetical protein